MKKLLWCIPTLVFLAACNDESGPSMQAASVNTSSAISAALQQGEWRISEKIEEGVDITGAFIGYTFRFDGNSDVKAFHNGDTLVGDYSVFVDDGRTELRMNFPPNSALYDLIDDWYFESRDSLRIRFIEVSDVLELHKIL